TSTPPAISLSYLPSSPSSSALFPYTTLFRSVFRILSRDRLQTTSLLTEFRARIVYRTKRPAQFPVQIRRIPTFGIDSFQYLEMLAEAFARGPQLFEFVLRLVRFPLQHHQRTRQLIRHLRPAAFQFFLPPA